MQGSSAPVDIASEMVLHSSSISCVRQIGHRFFVAWPTRALTNEPELRRKGASNTVKSSITTMGKKDGQKLEDNAYKYEHTNESTFQKSPCRGRRFTSYQSE